MKERVKFIASHLQHQEAFSELCTRARISRKKGYKRVEESTFRGLDYRRRSAPTTWAPVSTLAPGGLSRLAVWWIRLGIRPERNVPGPPGQNGRHERMHSTVKAGNRAPAAQQRAGTAALLPDFRQERVSCCFGVLVRTDGEVTSRRGRRPSCQGFAIPPSTPGPRRHDPLDARASTR
jgi:hypothetical protein